MCVCGLPQCVGHLLLPACQLVLAAMNPLIQNMAVVKTGGMPLQPWQMCPNSGQARQAGPCQGRLRPLRLHQPKQSHLCPGEEST